MAGPVGRSTPGAGGGLGGSYKGVIRPVTSPHVSTPHPSSATTTAKVPAWLNTAALTPAQMDQQATDEANASVAPEVQGIQQQQQMTDAQNQAYQAAMTGFYSALAPYMQAESGKVSDAYNSAATAMGDIAKGYSGVLGAGAQANADATTAALTRAGQTQAIPSAQAQANPGSALTDAFTATNGGIQGTSFAEQGAAKAAAAANAPTVWAAQGRDSLTEAVNKAMAGDQTYADQIAKVYATVPALRTTILNQIQTAQIDKQKLQDTEQNTQFNQNAKISSLNLQASIAKFNEQAKVAGLKLRGQQLNLTAQKYATDAYNSDRNYALALARLGISQKNEQLRALAQEYKLSNGGFSPSQLNKFNNTARVTVSQIQDARAAGQPPTYQAAMNEMAKANVPPSIAQTYLNTIYPATQRPIGAGAMSPQQYNATTGVSSKATPFDLVTLAKGYLGVPYKWGGTDPKTGLDCSAFVQSVYARVGIKIPRTTFAQVKQGAPVNLNQLQPGDLVFTEPGKNGPNHVGLYIGNGMIQESPHTGTVNSTIPLKNFLGGGFVAARRYLNG